MLVRILTSLVAVLFLTVVSFLAVELAPGDPAELILGNVAASVPLEAVSHIRSFYRFDRPAAVRYAEWLGDCLRGNWGYSLRTGKPVARELLDRLPATGILACGSLALALIAGLLLGTVSALHEKGVVDHAIRLVTVLVLSLPSFLTGLLLLYVCSFLLGWTPLYGTRNPAGYILPIVTLGTVQGVYYARVFRNSLIESVHREYFLALLGKGLDYRTAMLRHALRNALPPLVSIVGLRFAGLLGGVVIIETVFAIPGVGSYIFESIASRDYTAIQGYVTLMGVMVVGVNLLTDLSLRLIDPRAARARVH